MKRPLYRFTCSAWEFTTLDNLQATAFEQLTLGLVAPGWPGYSFEGLLKMLLTRQSWSMG